jgi:hypothetical protein
MKSVMQILDDQNLRYSEILTVRINVPANSESMNEIKISNLGAFACEEITGTFETLVLDGVNIVDDGVCRTSIYLQDGATALPLTNDFVDTDLILSAGRVKSQKATNNLTTANPSGFLFMPLKFKYVFAMNSAIQIRSRNTSDTANEIVLSFKGTRLRA